MRLRVRKLNYPLFLFKGENMIKLKFLAVVFLIFTVTCMHAQCLLRGKVTDEENQSLSNVTIRLLNQDTVFIKGVISDSIGQYVLSDFPMGHYLMSFSCIGYLPKYIQLSANEITQQLQPAIMKTNNILLNEVAVKGTSFIRQKDRVLILPDKQQVKHASTGYELLYNLMIPGLYIEPQKSKITALGKDVSLYIDGRKVDYREVQNLRPRDVEKVEYYDVPTGKYAGDFAAINYITRQYKSGGYVSVNAAQTIGYLKGNYDAVVKLNKGNTDYTLFTGYQMQETDGQKEVKHEEFYFDDYTVFRDSKTTDNRIKNNNQYYQLYVSNHNEKRTLTGKISLVRNASPKNHQRNSNSYTGYYTNEQYSDINTRQKNIMPEVYLYGTFSIKKNQQLEASLNGTYADNEYTRNYVENEFQTFTSVKEDFYNMDANVNYVISLKHKNSLTAKLYHLHKVSSSTYSGDNHKWQHLWSGETLFFVEYKQQLSNKTSLRFQPGISSLQYKLHGEQHVSHISPRLQMGVTIQPAKAQFIQIGVNIGNSYPEISTINSVDQTIDFLQIKRGNANMNKTNLYMTNVAYAIQTGQFNTQLAVSYLYANNMPINNYYIENDKVINSYQDGNGYQDFKIYLSSTWKTSDNFNVKLDSYFSRQTINKNFSFIATGFIAALSMNYFWKDFAFNAYGVLPYYAMDSFYSLGHKKIHGEYGLSASWSKKNWRIEVGTNSPFTKKNKIKMWLETDVYRFNAIRTGRINQQTGFVKVAYTFDFGRKTTREKNNINKVINSAIMKAN